MWLIDVPLLILHDLLVTFFSFSPSGSELCSDNCGLMVVMPQLSCVGCFCAAIRAEDSLDYMGNGWDRDEGLVSFLMCFLPPLFAILKSTETQHSRLLQICIGSVITSWIRSFPCEKVAFISKPFVEEH